MDNPVSSSAPTTGGSSGLLVAVYWLIVGVPLAWGVFQTAQKSVPLFHVTSAPVNTAPAGTAPTPPEK